MAWGCRCDLSLAFASSPVELFDLYRPLHMPARSLWWGGDRTDAKQVITPLRVSQQVWTHTKGRWREKTGQ